MNWVPLASVWSSEKVGTGKKHFTAANHLFSDFLQMEIPKVATDL